MTPEEKREAKKLYDIEYRKKNKELIKQKKREWAKNNPEKIQKSRERNSESKKLSDKKYAQKNKEKLNFKKKKWAKDNPKKVKKAKSDYVIKKMKEDPLYRFKHQIGCIIRQSFKRNGYTKKSKTYAILGCEFNNFKNHMESQFKSWMSWDNYGKYNGEENFGWDIDHIIPISSCINENDVIKLNHYTNLQPLCSKTNRDIKRNFIL